MGEGEHSKQKPSLKLPAAAEFPGYRREPVMQDRVPPELPSGDTAESFTHRSREIIPTLSTRRFVHLLLSLPFPIRYRIKLSSFSMNLSLKPIRPEQLLIA